MAIAGAGAVEEELVISVGPMRDADPTRIAPVRTATLARGGCACIPPRAMFGCDALRRLKPEQYPGFRMCELGVVSR